MLILCSISMYSIICFCSYCNILWEANFPRKKMIRVVNNADEFPCPGCIQKTLTLDEK